MTELQILEWLKRITVAAMYALEDGEPIYLARLEGELNTLIEKQQPCA